MQLSRENWRVAVKRLIAVEIALLAVVGAACSSNGPNPAASPAGSHSVVHQPTAIRFSPTVGYKTGKSPQQVTFGDFDGNGTVDLVTANQGANTVSLLSGQGDGTFAAPVSIPAGIDKPLAVASADLNGDGHPDVVAVNGRSPSRVAVLLGDGSGRFTASTYPGGHRSQWVVAADFNGDGHPDVATANAGGGVSVLIGSGDGALRPAVDYSTKSTMCSALTAADLNDDGHLDLVTTNSVLGHGQSDESISVLLGNPDGTFRAPVVYQSLGWQPTMPTTADLNGDGHLDVIAPLGGWPAHFVTVLLGKGDGTLGPASLFEAGPSAHDTVAVDLNGDGHVDLASSDLGTSSDVPSAQGILIRAGRGNGTFAPGTSITDAWPSGTWSWPSWIAAADLNGDGRIDLVAPDEFTNTVGVLLNSS